MEDLLGSSVTVNGPYQSCVGCGGFPLVRAPLASFQSKREKQKAQSIKRNGDLSQVCCGGRLERHRNTFATPINEASERPRAFPQAGAYWSLKLSASLIESVHHHGV